MRALTPRENEVLELVARGYTNQQIGDRLGISLWTARAHVSNAIRKLNVSNRTQAVLKSGHLEMVALEER